MEGITQFPFRLWITILSQPSEMTTPFLRVTSTFPSSQLPLSWAPELLHPDLKDLCTYRLIPQLMAASPTDFLRVAVPLLEASDCVEINYGCPSPRVVGHGAGSSILSDPQLFIQSVTTMCQHLGPQRLRVKMRTGFDHPDHLLRMIEGVSHLPIKKITIHGRTKVQGYKGSADWDLIESCARLTGIPIIGSGDCKGLSSYGSKSQFQAIDTILIGRGALRNPFIFSEIRSGQAVVLNHNLIFQALKLFVMLHEIGKTNHMQLLHLGIKHVFQTPMPLQQLTELLESQFFTSKESVSKTTLGQLKQLWCYLRQSLPQEFATPHLLRAQSFEEFLRLFQAIEPKQHAFTFTEDDPKE